MSPKCNMDHHGECCLGIDTYLKCRKDGHIAYDCENKGSFEISYNKVSKNGE